MWATAIGGVSTVDALKVSYEKAVRTYTETGSINNVAVSDILGVMGGVSDLAGGLLAKPGLQFAAGLALKGIGLGAAMGQNAVGDMTVGQLINASPDKTPVEAPSTAIEVVITATRLVADTITPPSNAASRNSASYISSTSANAHAVVIQAGGTVWDAYVSQKNAATGFANWGEYKAAVAASNPGIADLNQVAAGTTLMQPERMADASVTYHYSGGVSINSNPVNGEYHMVVQSLEGGQTVYSRTADEVGYTVRQVSTDENGQTSFNFTGYQETLQGPITAISALERTDTPGEEGVVIALGANDSQYRRAA